ncbi:ribonuclease 3-like protein 1 isoform X3 [Mercurialis annua]|uniref:ribonuclease 3-like protein 1 isoform X3 n=1 Tax=Mercurialis annua TaxID=3986 RepID=UPI00216060E6|nr:ribonuclease 3-like protein 1 isoform X3 [Mercurialis annua]
MDAKCLDLHPPPPPQQHSYINLKNLPPATAIPYYQVKKNKTTTKYVPKISKPRTEEELKILKFDLEADTEADLLAEQFQQHKIEDNVVGSVTSVKSIDSGGVKMASAKAQLHEICVANKWKPPVYECCREEGTGILRRTNPRFANRFTFKVVVEIKGAECKALECYGESKPRKKAAAELAAEGALWYLNHLGYSITNKKKKKLSDN